MKDSAKRLFFAASTACALLAAGGPHAARAQAPEAKQDAKQMEEARRHFQLGLNLLRDPEGEQIEPAYLEFKAAYDLSKSPRVLGNIGYCAMKLERNSESVTAYRAYLKLAPNVDPAERAQIEQDLLAMTDGAGKVDVSFAGGAGVEWSLVDVRTPSRGSAVTNVYGPTTAPLSLLMKPGRHVLRVKVGAEEQSSFEVDIVGGVSVTHAFEPKPPPAPVAVVDASPGPAQAAAPSRTAPWVTIGVGGALLAAGGVTGLLAMGKVSAIEDKCPANRCPAGSGYQSDVDAARTLGTTTDVLLIGGGVVAGTGLVWLLVGGKSRPEAAPPVPSVSSVCVPAFCGVSARGTF